MTDWISYLIFGILLLLALVVDLGLMSRKRTVISIRKSLYLTLFWVILSMAYCLYLWIDRSPMIATKYFAAYLMEWSLSVDNIFVFILIFTYFNVEEEDIGRSLLIGILLAILFRIAFIALGIELIERFHWFIYLLGAFLVYTGFRLFSKRGEAEFDPGKTRMYKFMQKYFRLSETPPQGRFFINHHGKVFFTHLAVVVFMLAAVDIAFALDSIPTVVSLVREKASSTFSGDDVLVIYSSNIFALLGLRSLFFLLKGAVNKFDFLQQGIAIVLIFIGIKMLLEMFGIYLSIFISLIVIVVCLSGSIFYSMHHERKRPRAPGSSIEMD